MYASILHHINTPPLGIGCVYTMLIDGSLLHASVYDVTIECCLGCTCIDFFIFVVILYQKERKVCLMQTFVFHLYQKDVL